MKKSQQALLCALALALGTGSNAARAEDIDLFIGTQASSNGLPNVLFIIDNTANWNQAFTNEKAALVNTFNNLPLNADGSPKFNVGIMLATETGNPNSNVSGGYVRAAIRPMTATNRALYAALIASLDKLADKGNGGYSALAMTEAYYYFAGLAPYAGNNKIKADFTGNTFASLASNAVYALSGNALSSLSATRYNPPGGSSCSKNYIIYISNGPNQESSSVDVEATTRLRSAGGTTTIIPLSPTGSQSNPSDEWARFMKTAASITTYTIDVDPPSNGQGPGWSALLESMATVSGGKPATVNSTTGAGQEISDAVNDALSEIQAVNSVFASVSLPLSVNTQGTYLNQVYVGLFRPDSDALPQWNGNLQQYKLGRTGLDLRLKDADDRGAINSLTGFITECARSYWTPTTPDTYWTFRPQGACIAPGSTPDAYRVSNFPDGNIVEKGAQAHTLRNTARSTSNSSGFARSLKTCNPSFSACTALTDFVIENGAISQSLLGAADATEREQLIKFTLGLDVDDQNSNDVRDEMRPSVHGDVVHSRPAAINFGTIASPNVVVFYGGNDGVFRAINGNRTTNIGSAAPGAELWGFVPPEFYGNIRRLRKNEVPITLANSTGVTLPKPYGMDGSVTAYTTSSSAWIYAGMRRGGRALYSFDVNVSDPADISLKWKIGCPENFTATGTVSDTGCSSLAFSGIGQTWSAPKTLFAAGYGSGPLLIMGGGYDPCEDREPHTCTTSSKGNKVYVMDANNGTLLNSFTTIRGVIADVAVVPDLTTGRALYAYVVDLGGNVYRIDIGSSAPSAWSITRIASLGCDTTSPCTLNRKFMFAPDITLEGGVYSLLLGSGDREKPRNYSNPVNNYFFMLKDRPGDATWLSSEATRCGSAVLCLASLTPILSSANPSQADLDAGKGWYLGLGRTEQVVTAAITIFGTVTFSTNQPVLPAAGVCSSNLGTARVYNVSYRNAAPEDGNSDRSQALPGSIGLPPSPVGGMVTLDDGQTVPFCIGCSPDSPLEGEEPKVPPSSAPSQPKGRVYWYIQR